MRKLETVHRKYNEKLVKLLKEFEFDLCESLGTSYQGVKTPIRDMISKESGQGGIATAYALYHRTAEFTEVIQTNHPIFKK
jgi:hypothetical protein